MSYVVCHVQGFSFIEEDHSFYLKGKKFQPKGIGANLNLEGTAIPNILGMDVIFLCFQPTRVFWTIKVILEGIEAMPTLHVAQVVAEVVVF